MRNFIVIVLLLLIICAALLAPSALRFYRSLEDIPPGVRLAGLDLGSIDAPSADEAIEVRFSEPVAVYYAGQRLILRPQMVAFEIDWPAMLAEAQAAGTSEYLARVFLGQMLDRPPSPVEIPLRYKLDSDALDNWLGDVALRYDRPPVPPQPLLDAMTVAPGQPGRQLDLLESRARVISALTNPSTRTADLVVREAEAPAVNMEALGRLLEARLAEFPGVGGLFLFDATTGEEVAVNADVAFAGMSTLKIAILEEVYRKLDEAPDVETSKLISETMSVSGNYTANLLLGIIGDDDAGEGVRVLNDSMRTLGLSDTFMATPYDRSHVSPPRIVTDANSRTDITTHPDPYMQTTPRDMGLLLGMLVQCSQGGGALLAAYGDQVTQAECQEALDYMALNEVHELLTGAVPEETLKVHKHGYVADTHGDVAAIWSSQGPYVLSVFLYRPTWLEWDISNTTMQELSNAVWRYYEGELVEEGIGDDGQRTADDE